MPVGLLDMMNDLIIEENRAARRNAARAKARGRRR